MEFKELLLELKKYGFITGSRAFGTHRDDSDWDLCYPIHESSNIHSLIKDFDREESDYFSGYTIKVEDQIINLIPIHPHEYLPWYLATKAMKETVVESGIQSRIKNHAIFLGIVCLFKGCVEERGNLDSYKILNQSLRLNETCKIPEPKEKVNLLPF